MHGDPDDNAAAKAIAGKLSVQQQAKFDMMALRGAHDYIAELEAKVEKLETELNAAATAALEQERKRLVKAVYNLIDENIEHRSTAQALRKVIAAIGDDKDECAN